MLLLLLLLKSEFEMIDTSLWKFVRSFFSFSVAHSKLLYFLVFFGKLRRKTVAIFPKQLISSQRLLLFCPSRRGSERACTQQSPHRGSSDLFSSCCSQVVYSSSVCPLSKQNPEMNFEMLLKVKLNAGNNSGGGNNNNILSSALLSFRREYSFYFPPFFSAAITANTLLSTDERSLSGIPPSHDKQKFAPAPRSLPSLPVIVVVVICRS